MEPFSSASILSVCIAGGRKKASLPPGRMFALAVLAGAWIAFAGAASSTAAYTMADPGLARLVMGLVFPFGLCMVLVLGCELVTGNCLMAAALADRAISLADMLKNWAVVCLGNWAGALLVAAGCAFSGQLNQGGGALAVFTIRLAAAKCQLAPLDAVLLGILCNVLVCAGVLMSYAATDAPGKIICAYLPIALFVICGFEHLVANFFYIQAGLFALLNPNYASMAAEAGIALPSLTWGAFLLKNLLPVTVGNVIGGAGAGLLFRAGVRIHSQAGAL